MIRQAKIEDIKDLLVLAYTQYKLSQFSELGFDFSLSKLSESLLFYINHKDAIALVVEVDNKVVGYFYGLTISPMYSTVKQAVEMAMFVDPEQRGKQLGKRLINEFINWAKEKGISVLQIENSTHADPERIAKLYQHYGFTKIGGTYQMIIEDK